MGRMSKNDPRRPENRLLPDDYFNSDCWYVSVTKPQKEFLVEARFAQLGLQTYIPRVSPRRRSRNGHFGPQPLFRRYVFVRLTGTHEYYKARWTPGVHGFVLSDLRPAAVSHAIVMEIQKRENESGLISELEVTFSPGERVVVIDGLFAGLQGFFQSTTRENKARIIISQTIKGMTPVLEIEENFLQPTST